MPNEAPKKGNVMGPAFVGTAIEGAKQVAKLAQEYGKLDLYQQAVELMAKITELSAENFELKQHNSQLAEKLRLKETVYFKDNVCFIKDVVGEEAGPYCSRCYQSDGKLIHLHEYTDISKICPVCKGCPPNKNAQRTSIQRETRRG